MKRKMMIMVVLAIAMIGSGTNTALAGCGPMPYFGCPPPGVEMGPDHFEERLAKILKLTKAQQIKIKALLDAEREKVKPLFDKMHKSREQLKQASDTIVFDETAVRAFAVAQTQIEVELIVSHTRTLNKINLLLTPEQRKLLSNLGPEGR